MSARKLGRFVAGLFVALGLVFGGSLAAGADENGTAVVAADTASIGTTAQLLEFEWT